MINNIFPYLIKMSIILGLLYIIFKLFFSKTNLHNLNRAILLFIVVFSIFCPILNINKFSDNIFLNNNLWIEDFSESIINLPGITLNNSNSEFQFKYNPLTIIYIIGAIFFIFRFIIQFRAIFYYKRLSDSYIFNKKRLFIVNKEISSFSFFNWIFIPENLKNSKNLNFITQHESVHSCKYHSIDLILLELLGIVTWFNPFVFLLKRSLKAVHEFQADSEVLKNSFRVDEYLLLLLKSSERICFSGVVNNFKSSTLKNRIIMISKDKTSGFQKISYLILIPIFIFLLFSFSMETDINKKMSNKIDRLFPSSINNNSFNLFSDLKFDDNIPDIWPIDKENVEKITSRYGMRVHPISKTKKMHFGIDLAAKTGTPVLATASGRVVLVEFKEEGKGYGRHVLIKHSNIFTTHYTQLSKFNVKTGDEIEKGDVIGYVGNSGLSTGSHLHYEVIKNGEKVDPEDYLP